MADPGEFAANAGELKATARYFDQIQRASDRLGRTRYQNIVKLNNELKFTSRYFDQIYRTALKLSRLKLMPRVTLDDKASKDIDRLLAKLAQIRSKRIQVAADVIMPIQPAVPKLRPQKAPSIQPKVPPSVKPKIDPAPSSSIAASPSASAQAAASASASAAASSSASQQQQQQSVNITITNPAVEMPELGSLEAAIASNTDAVLQLTGKLGTLSFSSAGGAEDKKPDYWSATKNILGAGKSIADGRVNAQTARTKKDEIRKLDQEWLARSSPAAGSDEEKKYRNQRELLHREATASKWSAATNYADGLEKSFTAGKELISSFKGGSEDQPSVTEAASNLIQETSNSGLLDNVAKGAVGKVLGPVATALQVGDVIRTTDDKERFEALGSATGSAIGGSAGAAIGSAIMPVIGTAVGGYLGSVAGDFVGGKVGGFIYENGGKVTEFLDNTMDKLSDKLNNLFSWGKDKEKTESKSSAASVPALSEMINGTPAMNSPMYNPAAPKPTDFLDPGGRLADWKAKQEAFVAPRPEQPKSANAGTQVSIEMSQSQLSTVTGTIQNAKPEVTNQISINIGPGTVQLDIHEEIDYAEIEGKIGAAIVAKVRQAFNNYKPAGGGGGSGGPSTAMAT